MEKMTGIFLLIALFLLTSCGPDPKLFEPLKNGKISQKARQKVLILETYGDPNTSMKETGKLFSVFYKMKFEGDKMKIAPRARWPKPFSTPREQWVGIWAMPVPDSVTTLPEGAATNMRLEEWYGYDMAEIVHFGPYSTETATIRKLHDQALSNGYEIDMSTHEEEYIAGPGMFGPGNPQKYITIIRYTVKKTNTAANK